jgi:hypothetical protein
MKKRNGPRVGRIFVEIGAVASVLSGAACGDAGFADGEPSDPALGTVEQAFDPSPDPSSPHGHVRITMKALKLLEARGMLPDSLKSAANQALIVYGNNFADRTSSGWPNGGRPTQPMLNGMSARVPDNQPLVMKAVSDSFEFEAELNDFPYEDPDVKVTGSATLGWFPGKVDPVKDSNGDFLSDSMKLVGNIKVETDVSLDLLWSGATCVIEGVSGYGDCRNVEPGDKVRDLSFAVDNMYHYSYADLRDTGAAFNEADTSLRLYPFFKDHIPGHNGTHTEQDAATKISDGLRGQTLLTGADYGAQKYGSILYQLARRFFAKSPQPEPDLAQLIKVGNDVSGWHTGWMQGHGELASLALEYPHTFLGGMPYVCAAPQSSGGFWNAPMSAAQLLAWTLSPDPCALGRPVWPSWIKDSPPQTQADLQALEQPRPGRSDRAALIYLGWAVHMLQDSAMPHHVAGWTGIEHGVVDAIADRPYYYTDYAGITVPGPTTCTQGGGGTTSITIPGSKLGGGTFTCTTTRVPHPYAQYSDKLVDKALAADLDNLLGPVGQKKSRNEVCRGLGIKSGDGSPTDLNWRAVYPHYLETAKKAYEDRAERIPAADDVAAGLRYVKNAVYGTIKLMLCSVPEDENLALNRPSWQSSTVWDAPASRVNDGNTSGNFWDGSVSHTDYGFTWVLPEASGQWWYVNLGSERIVNAVNIFNRTDCCSERLSHYKIFAWDSSAYVWRVISDQSAADTTNVPVLNHPINNVKTQYVMVAKTDENHLQLAEVQVMGN